MQRKLVLAVAFLFLLAPLARAGEVDWKRFNDTGWQRLKDGNTKDARDWLNNAVKEAEGLGRDDPRLGLSLAQLAWLNFQEKKATEADDLARRALDIFNKTSDKDGPQEARGLNVLAMLAQERKKPADAETLYRRALAIEEKAHGADHPIVAQLVSNLGSLYQSTGRYAEAEAAFRRALKVRQSGAEGVEAALSHSQLAALLVDRKKPQEAETHFRKALDLRSKLLSGDHPDIALAQNNLAALYYDLGRHDEAQPLLEKALVSREKTYGKEHPRVAAVLHNLAKVYSAQDKPEKAAFAGKRALAIRDKAAPDSLDLAASLELQARLQAGVDKAMNQSALDYWKRALLLREKLQGKDHRDVAVTLHHLANAQRDLVRAADADASYQRALALADKYYGPHGLPVARVLDDYAALLDKMKDRAKDAMHYRDRAKDIRAKAAKKQSS